MQEVEKIDDVDEQIIESMALNQEQTDNASPSTYHIIP